MKSDMSRVPEGWLGLTVYGVYTKGNQIIVLGEPDELESVHNCDVMGCGTLDHVLFRATVEEAVEHTLAPDGADVCHIVTHVFIDDTCAMCGIPKPRPAGKA